MKWHRLTLLTIVFLAFFLRFNKLGEIPPSLSWDEVSLGYNAYSLLETGRDEHGKFLPLATFEAYGDYKPPGYIYATVPFVALFGLNEFSVRVPSALAGSLTILVAYFLIRELFGNKSYRIYKANRQSHFFPLLSAFLLAISPWHLNLSRAGFEANLALFFIVMGIWLFFKTIHVNGKWLLASVIFFVLALYTFNSARIFIPFFGLLLLIIYRQRLWQIKKWVVVAGLLSAILLVPLIPHLLSTEGRLRFREVNIFSDLKPIETANKRIEIDKNMWWAKIIHNRRLLFALEMARHYFDNLNMNFLFINGDGNPKFSIRDVGQLYLWDLPFLVAGFYFLARKKEGEWFIPILWLLAGVLPAAVARETPHALRTENSLPSWQIITAYGFISMAQWLNGSMAKKKVLVGLAGFALLLNFSYYLHNYYFNYPKEFAAEWQWGYKEAIRATAGIEERYDKVRITDSIGRPYMYVLFYKKYDPKKFWQEVERTSDPYGLFNIHGFGKYEFGLHKEYENQKILYVQSPKDAPREANILQKIKYPNGKTALVIYD